MSTKNSTATGTAPGLTSRSGMISLDLAPGTIPVVQGGLTDHHITIVYLGSDVDDNAYARALDRASAAAAAFTGPIYGTVHGIGTFPPSDSSDGMTPAFAQVRMPGAHMLHAFLADLSASEHDVYHPHVTLKYLDDSDPLPDPVMPTPVTFTHLSVHRGETVRRIPLGPKEVRR
jgi:2'-5' RNA ligase